MIIIKEKENLDEMAICPVSSRSDGLPFRISVKTPDHLPPHAHVMDLKTGNKELGQFEIPKSMPRRPEDIKDYKQGISNEWRSLIFQWMKMPYKRCPEITNWEGLYYGFLVNVKW
jgi:hypothetical protein